MPRLDALFHRPGTVRVVLQKFFIVIGLDHKCLHMAQPFHDHFGNVTEIGNKSEAAGTGGKHEPERIDRVMRHGKRLHCHVADGKFRPGRKEPPIATSFHEPVGPKRFGGEPIAINRQIKFVAENFKAADVIGVLVCKNDAVELLRRHAALLQPQHDLSRAQSAINENLAMFGCDQRAVSRAPAAEHGEAEHGSKDSRLFLWCANRNVTQTIQSTFAEPLAHNEIVALYQRKPPCRGDLF